MRIIEYPLRKLRQSGHMYIAGNMIQPYIGASYRRPISTLVWHPTGYLPSFHRPALCTKAFSILPTSALNCSTSSQQSRGLRSFFLKQFLTVSRAFSTSGEVFSICLRDSSLAFKSMISCCTLAWLRPESVLGAAAAAGLPAL